MTTTTSRFVAYLIMRKKTGKQSPSPQANLEMQKHQVATFTKKHQPSELVETFIEGTDRQQHEAWSELKAAVNYCIQHHTALIIPEIKNLICNDDFIACIDPLIQYHAKMNNPSPIELYCCDQPVIHLNNFRTISDHAKQQKKIHGDLIRAGLSRTTAKSGNPHAADVINRVNRPKIENAIIFALLLHPVIAAYTQKGYSQRKMVAQLNQDGFTAPEGGRWVLSQLQKVIDRIKICESALSMEKRLTQYQAQNLTSDEIAEQLNKLDIPAPKVKLWDKDQVEKVIEKIIEIHSILTLNELTIGLLPILSQYHIDELTEATFLAALKKSGITIPETLRQDAA